LLLKINPSANEWFDDGRGDSPRLRPIYSQPRPSTETLAGYSRPPHGRSEETYGKTLITTNQ